MTEHKKLCESSEQWLCIFKCKYFNYYNFQNIYKKAFDLFVTKCFSGVPRSENFYTIEMLNLKVNKSVIARRSDSFGTVVCFYRKSFCADKIIKQFILADNKQCTNGIFRVEKIVLMTFSKLKWICFNHKIEENTIKTQVFFRHGHD